MKNVPENVGSLRGGKSNQKTTFIIEFFFSGYKGTCIAYSLTDSDSNWNLVFTAFANTTTLHHLERFLLVEHKSSWVKKKKKVNIFKSHSLASLSPLWLPLLCWCWLAESAKLQSSNSCEHFHYNRILAIDRWTSYGVALLWNPLIFADRCYAQIWTNVVTDTKLLFIWAASSQIGNPQCRRSSHRKWTACSFMLL